MSWFRLEGRGAFHHKVLAAGNEAYGAWCRAGQWSSDQLTDGAVPRAVAEQIAKPKVWSKLVEARLVHETDAGYQIHDYLDFNPSSEQERAKREEMREKRRESGRAGGKRSGEVRRGEANGKQTGSANEATAKQSASADASIFAKQNEAPSPYPNPIPSISHTHIAGAPAREDESEDDGRTMPTPKCSAADIAALLRSVPALADLADDPAMVTDLHSGYLMACMDAATPDLAREAIGALVSAENLREMSPRQRRERVGKYLSNARKYTRGTDRGSSPVVVTPDMRVVLTVFAEAWEAKKRRPYVQATGDEKHAAALVEVAWEHAGRLKMRPRDIVKHWAEKYLRDDDKFVADPEHPLRLLPSRLTTYGLPSAPAKPPTPAERKTPAEPPPPPPGDLVAALEAASAVPRRRASP